MSSLEINWGADLRARSITTKMATSVTTSGAQARPLYKASKNWKHPRSGAELLLFVLRKTLRLVTDTS